MKRIHIDGQLCQGTRLCEAIAADVIDFDDDGVAIAREISVPDEVAAYAASVCPSMALTVADV